MKPHLLYEQGEFQYRGAWENPTLVQDLELNVLLETMARHDHFIYTAMRTLLLNGDTDPAVVRYRQAILEDALSDPELFYRIYVLASDVSKRAEPYQVQMRPNYHRQMPAREKLEISVELLEVILSKLQELQMLGAERLRFVRSDGLKNLFKRLAEEFPESFFLQAQEHVRLLKLAVEETRLSIGARFGNGLKGTRFVLRELHADSSWPVTKKIIKKFGLSEFEHSFRGIEEAALVPVLQIVRRFIEETLEFFQLLRFEIGFYVGGTRLVERLKQMRCPYCFPEPVPASERSLTFRGLYNPVLALNSGQRPVGNDLEADGKIRIIITGANQGGKTTFLRSVGLAQLMMQAGLVVAADHFRANLCDRVYSHFARQEDDTMKSGRLDEELSRLAAILDQLTPDSLLLMNEPFASTTEREGSLIARDLLTVCQERNLKVLLVTHFYELAEWAYRNRKQDSAFLIAERRQDGLRSYVLNEGVPEQTSFGQDLFRQIIEQG